MKENIFAKWFYFNYPVTARIQLQYYQNKDAILPKEDLKIKRKINGIIGY